ncbi:MAG TPA: TMEM175 family protein [Candidatus Dormibacteraeota bacterium]|jgi:uncharacterized membrane protein|nr:TMEM175 family protein [Candidatus Dormibacteraeota bacterium]
MRTARLESFSDGVFAVAITLLVLDLVVPSGGGSLITALADEWPSFAAFALSFVTIGIIWVNHHVVFASLRRVDRPLLFINIALLMSVVLLPFSTSLYARSLVVGGDQAHVAAALFAGSLLFMSLWFDAAYVWIGAHPELRRAGDAPPVSIRSVARFGAGIVVYAGCIGLAFASALAVLIVTALVAVYYMVDRAAVSAAEED